VGLSHQIDNDLVQALKGREELKCSVLRMLKTAVKNAEIQAKAELSDDEVLKVIDKQAKQRKDSIEQYEKGGRKDLVEKERQELALLDAYLPEKMTDDDVRKYIVEKVNAGQNLNFGQLMGVVMKDLGTKADGQVVRNILQDEISKRNG